MSNKKYDYLIVGSGAGGATLARELSRRKKDILIIEAGKNEKVTGRYDDARRNYDSPKKLIPAPKTSKEGVIIWRTLMAGGSTVVSCGNGVRCLEKELSDIGINLSEEFSQIEKEIEVAPIAERLLSDGSRKLTVAAKELGCPMQLMPKFINSKACRKCGNCILGCAYGAKWTARNYLHDALENGCEIMLNTTVQEIIINKGKVKGVRLNNSQGVKDISADVVILAAGGIGTPIILRNSGINDAGSGLFVDLYVNAYGITSSDNLNQVSEPAMTLVNLDFHRTRGFLLSPFVNHYKRIKFVELGLKGLAFPTLRTLGIMIKTTDDPSGHVYPDGSISKPVTEKDWARLKEGSSLAKEILFKAGAKSIAITRVQGAHPGGTAAIGKVVDKNLQSKVEGLFVCDASVLPKTPGLPPILTIAALAKRLGKALA